MNIIKGLYIHERFFRVIAMISGVFLLSFWFDILYSFAWILLITIGTLFFIDIFILFRYKKGLKVRRLLSGKFSNSDENPVPITITNNFPFQIEVKLIDELPKQFQKRDFEHIANLKIGEAYNFEYKLIPVERGEYHFGNLHAYVSSPMRIVARRFKKKDTKMVAVYPSFIQMRKYEFLAIGNHLTEFGLKKIRRIGHTMEFEQINEYVPGDDVRTINWKL